MRAYHAGTLARRIDLRTACASLLATGWLLVASSAPVRAECTTSICSGDPCTITGTHVLDAGCDLDFGCARVTIGVGATVQSDGNSITIEAGDLNVRGTLRARAGSIGVTTTACGLAAGTFGTEIYSSSTATVDVSGGGDVTITADGDCPLNGRAINADENTYYSIAISCANISGTSAIHSDGSGGNGGGWITIAATAGYVNLNSSITANGGGASASGGSVDITAATTLTVGGASKPIQAKGGTDADGGSITLTAGGTATINGSMNVNGAGYYAYGGTIRVDAGSISTGTAWYANGSQSGRGGDITLYALPLGGGGTITTTAYNLLNAVGGSGGGYGGTVDVEADSTMNLSGDISVAGSGNTEYGGDGGTITISTDGAATLNSTLNANGSGDGGWGGGISVTAGTLTTGTASMMKVISGTGGYAGTIDVTVSGDMHADGDLDASGSGTGATGNAITVNAGTLTTTAYSLFKAISGSGGYAGTIDVSADSIDLSGDMDAGSSGAGGTAGTINISAGNGSSNTLTVRSTSNIGADSAGTDSSTSDGSVNLSGCNINVSGVVDTRNIYLSGGSNSFSYAGTFITNTGSSLLADDDGGNNVYCRCVDANADGICDVPVTCANAPTFNGTVTPAANLTPVMMSACS